MAQLKTIDGRFYDIPDCIFYACTGPNQNDERTGNFGTGCLAPPRTGDADIRSPLAFNDDHPYAEFNYVLATQISEPGLGLITIGNSFLTLYKEIPDGYQMLDILPKQRWMSLRPKKLYIGGKETSWPGKLAASSIAMVDTGGGPVFLSDPERYLWAEDWPAPARLPTWIGGDEGSYSCQATSADLSITLTDEKGREYSYRTDTNENPQNGMNIGGLSALLITSSSIIPTQEWALRPNP